MTWRSTLVYWGLFGVLAGYYAAVESKARPVAEVVVAREKVLGGFADEVTAITLRRDGREVRCERRDERWQVIRPPATKVPADLIAVLVDNVTEKQEAEEISAAPRPEELQAFGLADAATVLEVEMAGGKTASVKLGSRNPPQTAVYAQTSLSPRVLLVGLNVQYYTDLLDEAGRSASGAASAAAAGAKN